MTELRIPLLNARAADVVDFGSGFVVRPATEDERSRWADQPIIRDVVPHRVMPEIRSVLVCTGHGRYRPGQADSFEEELMVWFGLASLLTGRAVEAAFCEEWLRSDDGSDANEPDGGRRLAGPLYFRFSLPVTEAPPWNGPIALDGIAEHLRDQLPMFRSARPFAGTFRYALARWYTSLNKNRRTLEDAVVDLSIALEALFVVDDDRYEIASLMRERIARYWWAGEGTKRDLRMMKDHVHNVYDVRSRIVHGTIVHAERLSEARSILDEVVREVIIDFVTGKLDDFDPRRYWMPLKRPGFVTRLRARLSYLVTSTIALRRGQRRRRNAKRTRPRNS
jgi:hypothetical protein